MTAVKSRELSTDTLLKWYRKMSLMRFFEDEAERCYQEGLIAGYHHVYSGQEAVAVGTFSHLGAKDHVITTYRDHGPALARGIGANEVMAELQGKFTGTSKGKGGSMHLASRELNFWGGYAIVAGHLPLAAGIALADQYRGSNSVTVCMFGEGASNNGYFHEALNMAKIWKLPVIYLCENNQYSMWTVSEEISAVSDVYRKAVGYDIPSKPVDGMNVLDLYDGMIEAMEHVRSGKGPFFIEAKTYRYRGHGPGDIENYRSKEEVEEYRKKDPIIKLGRYLVEERGVSPDQLDELQRSALMEVKEAVDFAMDSPEPPLETLWDDIFAKPFNSPTSASKGRS